MPRITIELLRKRAEHNEGIISTLEEISLHQEELERIEVIGTHCRKLRILYLQNNIIERIEDLTHMKELRYLNLALNNITRIEGLRACEFLEKLDLTVNFVDFDELEASVDHLKPLEHLRELYMLGNPCQSNWSDGFREYVIASLPQLRLLDGKEITRSDRIKALQVFPERQRYVREQAVRVRTTKQREMEANITQQTTGASTDDEGSDDEEPIIEVHDDAPTDISRARPRSTTAAKPKVASDEKVPYTPHSRREMYLEIAEQKEEEEARRRENMPRDRDMEAEHAAALESARRQEDATDEGRIRQCNEGRWDFRIRDEDTEIVLEVDLPRFLDTSMIDVDVHPSYVSIVIKNKLFRLRFPELVHSDKGKAERSKVTGTLRLTLPKAHLTPTQRLRAELKRESQESSEAKKKEKANAAVGRDAGENGSRTTVFKDGPPRKVADEVLDAAQHKGKPAITGPVKVRGLLRVPNQDENARVQLRPILTKGCPTGAVESNQDEDSPPLIF